MSSVNPRPSRFGAAALVIVLACSARAAAQDTGGPATRTAEIEQAQAAKAAALHPFTPGRVEAALDRVEDLLVTGKIHVHPFFDSAYASRQDTVRLSSVPTTVTKMLTNNARVTTPPANSDSYARKLIDFGSRTSPPDSLIWSSVDGSALPAWRPAAVCTRTSARRMPF